MVHVTSHSFPGSVATVSFTAFVCARSLRHYRDRQDEGDSGGAECGNRQFPCHTRGRIGDDRAVVTRLEVGLVDVRVLRQSAGRRRGAVGSGERRAAAPEIGLPVASVISKVTLLFWLAMTPPNPSRRRTAPPRSMSPRRGAPYRERGLARAVLQRPVSQHPARDPAFLLRRQPCVRPSLAEHGKTRQGATDVHRLGLPRQPKRSFSARGRQGGRRQGLRPGSVPPRSAAGRCCDNVANELVEAAARAGPDRACALGRRSSGYSDFHKRRMRLHGGPGYSAAPNAQLRLTRNHGGGCGSSMPDAVDERTRQADHADQAQRRGHARRVPLTTSRRRSPRSSAASSATARASPRCARSTGRSDDTRPSSAAA